ncbi:hypothetical protein M0802_001272 [Mischocyttarus mexicanus]|nr:hypothetical protein M0802_001272 [Mischocyttarus mexicanus]
MVQRFEKNCRHGKWKLEEIGILLVWSSTTTTTTTTIGVSSGGGRKRREEGLYQTIGQSTTSRTDRSTFTIWHEIPREESNWSSSKKEIRATTLSGNGDVAQSRA